MSDKRKCLQIGLRRTAEFTYLCEPDWRVRMRDQAPYRQLPSELCDLEDQREWAYFGVEKDMYFIQYVAKNYKKYVDARQASFICTSIGLDRQLRDSLVFYTEDPKTGKAIKGECAFIPSLSLDTLIRALGWTHLDVLAIDIEGDETLALETYSWSLKPKFLLVEAHDPFTFAPVDSDVDWENASHHRGKELIDLITAQGYKCLATWEDEIREDVPNNRWVVKQLQFVIQ